MSRKLGRYELVELLGQGGMGEVWLARISGAGGFEKPCIVKMVLPALVQDRQFVERFLHEGKVLVHLSHSNIAQVYDMRDEEGVLYMALEYVAGVDVWKLMATLEQGQELVPVPVALFIASQAAEGLSYAHHKSAPDGTALAIVHRDVSPQNVMISYEGEIKVIDFGIARSSARSHATQAAMVVGKLGYMSPEQATAVEVDARSDQFALGVMLWELLAGRRFVQSGQALEMLAAMSNPKLQPLPPLRSEVDAKLDAVVQKALAPNPADRYPTTEDFAQALLAELNRLGGQPSKRQIGEWVKLKCSESWQTSQKMLSRIATTTTSPAPPAAPEPPGNLNPTRAMPKPIPLVTPSTELAPAPARSNALPLIVAVGVLLLAGVGGWWALTRPAVAPGPALVVKVEPSAEADASVAVPVKVEAPPEEPMPPPPLVPAPAMVKARISATARMVADPKPAVRLKNIGDATMTRCWVVVPGQRRGSFASLPPGFERELVIDQLSTDVSAPSLTNQVRIDCAQGSLTLAVQ